MRALLRHGLAGMARRTKTLAVRGVVPQVRTSDNRDDVVGVGLTPLGTHAATRTALPVVTLQHGQPPRLVLR